MAEVPPILGSFVGENSEENGKNRDVFLDFRVFFLEMFLDFMVIFFLKVIFW